MREDALPGFGKNTALGDLEILCEPAPLQVGNRVWKDLDGDGEQDPGETALEGVTVNLCDSTGAVLATTTTDSNGNYLFDAEPNTDYIIKLNNPADYAAGGALFDCALTGNDLSARDTIDSDGVVDAGGFASFAFTTGDIGANDHSIDFGFSPPIDPVRVGNFVWWDVNQNGIQDIEEPGIPGVVITLMNKDTGVTIGTTTTNSNGFYLFDTVPAGLNMKLTILGSNGDAGNSLENFTLTVNDAGGNDALDSDYTGDFASGFMVMDLAPTLEVGEDLSFDAGFFFDVPTLDMTNLQQIIDGSAGLLLDAGQDGARARRRGARQGQCDAFSAAQRDADIAQMEALYDQIWTNNWNVLTGFTFEFTGFMPSFCESTAALDATLDLLTSTIRQLRRASRSLVKRSRCDTPTTRGIRRRIRRNARAALQGVVDYRETRLGASCGG